RMSLVSPKNINFVAMRSPAKPLSASVDPDAGSGPDFDSDLAGTSFRELQAFFHGLTPPPQTQQPSKNPNPKALSSSDEADSQLDKTGDFSASTIDINTLSEGSINSLSF